MQSATGSLGFHVHAIVKRFDPLLAEFSIWIPFLDLSWKKFFLSVCQTGAMIAENAYLTKQLHETLEKSPFPVYEQRSMTMNQIESYGFSIIASPIIRSFISMMLRCEITMILDGSSEAWVDGIRKEFLAAKNIKMAGNINYSSLFDLYSGQPWTVFSPITPRWKRQSKMFMERLVRKITRRRDPIIPAYQRNKNMSRDSAQRLYEDGYQSEKRWQDFGTIDLEAHYAKTGRKVLGMCECRAAWKYGDLKPRCYYCIGGECYWPSRYVKPIAIDFMDSNPITEVLRRSDPTNIAVYLSPEDWICLWDLTSFTTSLVELRQFLYYVSRYMESDIRCQQNHIPVFDSYEGIKRVPVWEILDEYNKTVNEYSEFTMMRLIETFMLEWETDVYQQENSGMLGVPGNIGFSTCLHGVHILPLVDEDKGVGVGDDEMIGDEDDPREKLIPHIQQLGDIHEEKFEIIPPQGIGESVTSKFVKRGLTRTVDDLYLDKLFTFPLLPYGLEIRNPDRTVTFTPEEGISKFTKQIGSLYWDIHDHGQHVGEEDLDFIRGVIKVVYFRWNMPFGGSLPGRKLRGETFEMAIPPCDDDFDPRFSDWAEVIWDRRSEMYALLPVRSVATPFPEFLPGYTFFATENRVTVLLEGIRVVEKLRSMKEWVEVTEENRRRFRDGMRKKTGFFSMNKYRYTDFEPPWLIDFLYRGLSTVPLQIVLGVYGQGIPTMAINYF